MAPTPINLVIAGDSLVSGMGDDAGLRGWTTRLNRSLTLRFGCYGSEKDNKRYFDLTALGFSGIRTFELLQRLPIIFDRYPHLLGFQIGTNDLMNNNGTLPPDWARQWLLDVWDFTLAKFQKTGIKLFLLGLLPVDESRMPVTPAPNATYIYKDADNRRYSADIAAIAKKHAVPFCDFSDFTPAAMTVDGIHPNAIGCDFIATRVEQFLEKQGWLSPDSWPLTHPTVDVVRFMQEIGSRLNQAA